MLRPTPPREVVTAPGLVECLPNDESVSVGRAVISTAAEPMTTKSARAYGRDDKVHDRTYVLYRAYRRGTRVDMFRSLLAKASERDGRI